MDLYPSRYDFVKHNNCNLPYISFISNLTLHGFRNPKCYKNFSILKQAIQNEYSKNPNGVKVEIFLVYIQRTEKNKKRRISFKKFSGIIQPLDATYNFIYKFIPETKIIFNSNPVFTKIQPLEYEICVYRSSTSWLNHNYLLKLK